MAPLASLLIATTLVAPLSLALQVTPNSPCASFCIDSDDLDRSDLESSNTKGSDMTCDDDRFGRTVQGQKFQRCMTCLQDSSFADEDGVETDQQWFLYNLRFSVNYCVFGFPNATDVGSSPCVTSEACGPLEDSLRDSLLDPTGADPYGYCANGGQAAIGDAYEKCLQCVHAGGTHAYLTNFLIALEAGCQQQPAPGTFLGLNDTVFTRDTIEIVDPGAEKATDGEGGPKLPVTTIVGISMGCLAVLLLLGGCAYMHVRKRKNRAARARRHRTSPLSFQCQTHLTPRNLEFFPSDNSDLQEKAYVDPSAALRSNPVVSKDSIWTPSQMVKHPAISITTSLPAPPPVHSSPQRASPDDYTSPASATSYRSNAPLLRHKPYVPSEYANSPEQKFTPSFSPMMSASPFQRSPPTATSGFAWDDQPLAGAGRDITAKPAYRSPSSKMEATIFPTSFPPPPKR